jgi:hypothetical protein
MQMDASGGLFWQVKVTSDTAYIATWERSAGIWHSAEEAKAALTSYAQCASVAKHAYLDRFTSYADFAASPTTQLTPGADTRYQWATSDETTLAAFKLCQKQSEWQWDQTQSSATGTPNQAMINISAGQMGPGTHDLFVVGVSYPDDQACSVKWPDSGAWSGYGCPPEFTVDEMTVVVG